MANVGEIKIFKLKTVSIDLDKNKVLINGMDLGSATHLNILYENGSWRIKATKDLIYEALTKS